MYKKIITHIIKYIFFIFPIISYAQPSNNDRSNAIVLSNIDDWCSADTAYTTVSATADQSRGSCWNTGPNYNVWFMFQATTTNIEVTVRIGGSEGTMDYPYIALWDTSLTQMECKRYIDASSDIGVTSTSLTIGQWYYISIDNYSSTSYCGTFKLCVTDKITYDWKDGAKDLSDSLSNNSGDWSSADAIYTTTDGTQDEARGSC
ncbi:MAG: hypothetical protein U9R42_11995, partial [Bacteroidota bacterium]|nr:hypothetical protein [Bacteroidota bacterium]